MSHLSSPAHILKSNLFKQKKKEREMERRLSRQKYLLSELNELSSGLHVWWHMYAHTHVSCTHNHSNNETKTFEGCCKEIKVTAVQPAARAAVTPHKELVLPSRWDLTLQSVLWPPEMHHVTCLLARVCLYLIHTSKKTNAVLKPWQNTHYSVDGGLPSPFNLLYCVHTEVCFFFFVFL